MIDQSTLPAGEETPRPFQNCRADERQNDMTGPLVKYEAARRALAEAHRVDEVKDIRDKAAAMQVYAAQAKDRELIEMATDIKMRAERRAGELLREMPKNKGTAATGGPGRGNKNAVKHDDHVLGPPKLSDIGITKDESSRWQKLAAMPEKQFEEKVTGMKTAMRAKTEGSQSKGGKKPALPKQTDRHRRMIELNDAGQSPADIAAEIGITERQVHQILLRERVKRASEDAIDPGTLAPSAQERLAAAIRSHQRELDAAFERRVLDEVRRRLDEIVLPHWKQQIDEAKRIYEQRKGIMDKVTFNKVRRGLHPDSRNAISDKVLGDAFDTFMRLEKFLLNEKDSPTDFARVPSTLAEWEAMKQKASAERRAKRHHKSNIAQRH